MMRKGVLLLLMAVVSVDATAEEWLCIADLSAGFAYKNGKWKAASGPSKQKYVLAGAAENEIRAARLLKRDPPVWVVRKLGESNGMSCGDFNDQHMLLCRDVQEFSLNKQTGRFLHTYPLGYFGASPTDIETKRESADAPRMIIGKCHPMVSVKA